MQPPKSSLAQLSSPGHVLHLWCSVLCSGLALAGCSMQRLALEQTAGILKNAQAAFEREWDHELAAPALEANVKLVEGFLQSGPGNATLLELAAKVYTSYALMVLEERLGQLEDDTPPADRLRRRTGEMYLRGHRFGLRWVETRRPGFVAAFAKGREPLRAALARCDAGDAPALVWVAMPLVSAINLQRDDVTLIAQLAKARAVVERVVQLDERHENAAGHLMLGSMLGGVSAMFGGDPNRARRHFERALQLTGRRFLLIQIMYAQTLAVQLQDAKLFRALLDEVVQAKLELYPEQKLANVVAKRKAQRLLARAEELF